MSSTSKLTRTGLHLRTLTGSCLSQEYAWEQFRFFERLDLARVQLLDPNVGVEIEVQCVGIDRDLLEQWAEQVTERRVVK